MTEIEGAVFRAMQVRIKELDDRLHDLEHCSGLVSSSFWRRAFSAYGHIIVAQITLTLAILLVVALFGILATALGTR